MNSIMGYGRWILFGSWTRERPEGSHLTWGRLAASSALATLLAALVFAGLAAGGFLGAVAVSVLWVPAQAAVVAGLVYAAGFPAGSARITD